jgi:CRP/FNR family transcriptional regulator, cyclic AMP receptor protein
MTAHWKSHNPISQMTDPSFCSTELPALGFLSHVSSEHRSFLACFGKYQRPNAGDVLITEGERQDCLYVILQGNLNIVTEVEGQQVLIASLTVGDSIGEVNLFDPGTASATVVVRTPSVIWSLTREELEAFIEADPVACIEVFRGLLAQVSRRIRKMNEKYVTADIKSVLQNFWGTNERA